MMPMLFLLSMIVPGACTSQPQTPEASVEITYQKSSYADFLFYLFYRSTNSYHELKTAVPLDDVPPLQDDSFLPNDVATSQIASYGDLYKTASTYDDHARLTAMLQKAEPHYLAFLSFWQQRIAPSVNHTITTWQKERSEWDPISHLEQMEHLKFPFSSIRIVVLALNPQGSSMQGAHPTIFTTPEIPSLAWAIGHEGTHMILGPKGADWKNRKMANEAIRLMVAHGGSDYDIEEALCLLMQAKMSIASGVTPNSYLTSSDLTKASPRRTLLLALEHDWPSYLSTQDTNSADWLISETIKTFGTH